MGINQDYTQARLQAWGEALNSEQPYGLGQTLLLYSAAWREETERLSESYENMAENSAVKSIEIERLRADLSKWKARTQVMRDYLTQYSGPSTTLWRDFCRVRPEAVAWFDADGAPK
jgi:hypothetical protein